MPRTFPNNVSLVLTPELRALIDARGDRSAVVRESLDRYYTLLRRALADLREREHPLTEPELRLILNAVNGTAWDSTSIRHLADEIADCIRYDGTAETYGCNGEVLVAKLRGLSDLECTALVDACERWWVRAAAGEQIGGAEVWR